MKFMFQLGQEEQEKIIKNKYMDILFLDVVKREKFEDLGVDYFSEIKENVKMF